MKRTICALLFLLVAAASHGQTTAVTATISDSQGTAWINAPYSVTWAGQGTPSTTSGQSFTLKYTGTTNGSGVLSISAVTDVAYIVPANSKWNVCVAPATSSPTTWCVLIGITGASENISTQINAAIQPPSITGNPFARAYADAEVTGVGGNEYFNITSNIFRCYTTAWNVCVGSGGGNISGTVSATHLTMGTGADTVGDSPATFDGTTFVFPNPFSVQAHSAFGVGSSVDSGDWVPDLYGSSLAIANFTETSTTAEGIVGVVSDVTWNPTATATNSYPASLGVDLNVNSDGQSATTVDPTALYVNSSSNGNTTALAGFNGEYILASLNGTAPVFSFTGSVIETDNNTTAAVTRQSSLDIIADNNSTGRVDEFGGATITATNSGGGSINSEGGLQITLNNNGNDPEDCCMYGVFSTYNQSGGTSTLYRGYMDRLLLTGGALSTGWTAFQVNGAQSSITVTAPGALPALNGFQFIEPTAPAHVITNEIALNIGNVTQGDNNIAIQTLLGLIKFGDKVTAPNITLTSAAPTVSASQVGFGGTTAAASNCNQSGVLTGVAGCLVINVAGTTHYVPYF